MLKSLIKLLVGTVILAAAGFTSAGERGTADEATALLKKATAYLKANGRDKAFAEFNNPTGAFKDRDLYVMVYDKTGTNLAHGANAKLIGKNLVELKDADGKLIVKSFVDVAFSGAGKGWVDYKWPNPVSKAVEQKSTYIERYEDVMVGVGIYK
ncbi:MAG: cache domain-containing protein [Burkholderiaceae bacterium]|nr:cache domain-containing protein [Burkholderiaceae bacterium]